MSNCASERAKCEIESSMSSIVRYIKRGALLSIPIHSLDFVLVLISLQLLNKGTQDRWTDEKEQEESIGACAWKIQE